MKRKQSIKHHRSPTVIIHYAVRLDLHYPLSDLDTVDLLVE